MDGTAHRGDRAARPRGLWVAARWACALVGAGLLAVFYAHLRQPWVAHTDFDQLFLAGTAWRRGVPPYGDIHPAFRIPGGPSTRDLVFLVYAYPPLTSMIAAPFSLLPFRLASDLWQYVSVTALLAGVWLYSRAVLPDWSAGPRLLVVGLTAHAGSLRWNVVLAQPTTMEVALLLLFAWAAIRRRTGWTALLAVLVSLKPTYFLPVAALLLFQGRWRLLGGVLAAILALNAVALVPTGPRQTVAAYRLMMRDFGEPGHVNDPRAIESLGPLLWQHPESPLRRDLRWSHRPSVWADQLTHLVFTFSAWTRTLATARVLAAAVGLAMLGLVALLWARAREGGLGNDTRFLALVFGLTVSLSLLLVYHQRYDCLSLLACVFPLAAVVRWRPSDAAAWVGLAASFGCAYALRQVAIHAWTERVVVAHGWLFLTPLCGYLVLATFACSYVVALRSATDAARARREGAVTRGPAVEGRPVAA